ncbi:MAG: anti-sigma factor [Pseudolabrys sp.]
MTDTPDHNDDDLLAAELVLGVLAGTDRAAALRLKERDSHFARVVTEWEQRLAPWAGEIAEVTPPPQVWERIAATLPADKPKAEGLWESLAFWRIFALAGTVAAACLAVVIYAGSINQQPPLVASIDGGGHRHFVATIDGGRIAVQPAAYTADATREPELWLIPADGKPRPLGMLRADRAVSIALPRDLAALTVSNAVLAVSLEPPGGSTTGAPTGPVIATGKLTSL